MKAMPPITTGMIRDLVTPRRHAADMPPAMLLGAAAMISARATLRRRDDKRPPRASYVIGFGYARC